MKVESCAFSGVKVYPGRGRIFVRGDNRAFRFVNGKTESLFLQRKNPRRLTWTQLYRKMHKKGINEEQAKKRVRRTIKKQRGIVGATIDVIREKRNQRPEIRAAQRAEALKEVKEKKQKSQSEKKALKAKSAATSARGQAAPKRTKQPKGGSKPRSIGR